MTDLLLHLPPPRAPQTNTLTRLPAVLVLYCLPLAQA